MKAAVVVFSPSGNTGSVAEDIKSELVRRGHECRVFDATRDPRCFVDGNWTSALEERVGEHDVLFVGGPVYAHHTHFNVKTLIRSLPPPGGKWGAVAVPFVTYGSVSSGVALAEAGKLLEMGGRTVVAGLKVAASHKMTRAFMDEEFNPVASPEPARRAIKTLVDRISALRHVEKPVSRRRSLSYNGFAAWLKANLIFREEKWHAERYPKVVIDHAACSGCGRCVKSCPVLRLRAGEGGRPVQEGASCIHCLNCVVACPKRAVGLSGDLERGRRFMAHMIEKHANKETPATEVYPARGDTFLSGGGPLGDRIFKFMLNRLDTPRRSGVSPAEALEIAGLRSARRVLEVGCGSGYYTRHAPGLLSDGASFTAIDIHPDAVATTARRTPASPAVSIEVGDALRTRFDDESFDLILLFGILPSPFLPLDEIIPEMMRVARPNAVLALWTLDPFWRDDRMERFGALRFGGRSGVRLYRKAA